MTAYREWRPPGPVGALLECAWQARTGPSPSGEQRVLPDGCMDLLLLDGRLVVAGPDTTAHTACPEPGAVTTGLRFRPGALPTLLGVPAADLLNQRVSLSDMPRPLADRNVTVPGGTDDDRGAFLGAPGPAGDGMGGRGATDSSGTALGTAGRPDDGLDLRRGAPGPTAPAEMRTTALRDVRDDRDARLDAGSPASLRVPVDRTALSGGRPGPIGHPVARDRSDSDAALLLGVAARLVRAAHDHRRPLPGPLPGWALRALAHGVATADVADRLGVTTRTLHRTCLATLGYGPSVARRVLRFRTAAALLYSGVAPADVAARTGYADQPHLSREVRALAGVSPTVLAAG